MSDKDTISMQLVREALLQTCPAGEPDSGLLARAGIAVEQLHLPEARVSAESYARLWRLLARRCNDEFFAMDPRGLRQARGHRRAEQFRPAANSHHSPAARLRNA